MIMSKIQCIILLKEVVYMSIKCTVAIHKEENWYVAKCLENGVASQGKTLEDAIKNLNEAVALYYDDVTPPTSFEPIFVTTLEVAI